MKLASYKRIFAKDFDAENQDLVDKLSLSVNQGIEDLHLALSNRLTFSDNFQAQIQDIEVAVDGTGKPKSDLSIRINDSNMKVNGLIVIGCRNLINQEAYPTTAPFISWTSTASGLKVNNITGLAQDNRYSIRVLII